jgi:hypothetical protein
MLASGSGKLKNIAWKLFVAYLLSKSLNAFMTLFHFDGWKMKKGKIFIKLFYNKTTAMTAFNRIKGKLLYFLMESYLIQVVLTRNQVRGAEAHSGGKRMH